MRYHLLKMLRELGGGTKIDDHDIVAWANATAATTGSSVTIKNTKDKKLKDGRYLLHLVAAIEPRAVDFKIVTACTDGTEGRAVWCTEGEGSVFALSRHSLLTATSLTFTLTHSSTLQTRSTS